MSRILKRPPCCRAALHPVLLDALRLGYIEAVEKVIVSLGDKCQCHRGVGIVIHAPQHHPDGKAILNGLEALRDRIGFAPRTLKTEKELADWQKEGVAPEAAPPAAAPQETEAQLVS